MSTKKYWRGIEEINPSEEYLAKVKNEFEEREITLGLESEEFVEVTSGLSESDEVLIPE